MTAPHSQTPPISVDKGFRVSCYVADDLHPRPGLLDASGAAQAGAWLPSDRVVFEVYVRTRRYNITAGYRAFFVDDGTQISVGTVLDTTDEVPSGEVAMEACVYQAMVFGDAKLPCQHLPRPVLSV